MHNYLTKLSRIWDQEKFPPHLYDVFIAHDSWCGINFSRECNCDPDIRIKRRKAPRTAKNGG